MEQVKPKVFIDTCVLLKGFSALRKQAPLPACFTESAVERWTFEKCVYEVFMNFRGVANKNPHRGTGKWAKSNLKEPGDPAPVASLAAEHHDDSVCHAQFWTNQILEAGTDIDGYEEAVLQFVRPEQREAALADVATMRKLAEERGKYDALCSEFWRFLAEQGVSIVTYAAVFTPPEGPPTGTVDPRTLSAFAAETCLPSEDFEVVLAAMKVGADIVVTDDQKLIDCTPSLGLNFPLCRSHFCRLSEFEAKLDEVQRDRHR